MSKKETFESALQKIESIVGEMENGEMPLDDLLKNYEQASDLIAFCLKKLDEAQGKLEKLSGGPDEFKLEPM